MDQSRALASNCLVRCTPIFTILLYILLTIVAVVHVGPRWEGGRGARITVKPNRKNLNESKQSRGNGKKLSKQAHGRSVVLTNENRL